MSGDNLANSKVLITGGAGLIGSHIADALVKNHVSEIRIFDDFSRGTLKNLQSALSSGRVSIIEGDIRDRTAVARATEGIDFVFHQAAIRITRCAEEPRLALEVLADGTFNVIEASAKAGVKRIIAASSASIYGLADDFPTTEWHHPYNNDTIYGVAKTFNEGLLRSFFAMQQLPYVGLRYFNVYGPRMDIFGAYTEVLIRWMENIASGRPPIIFGDGSQTMDFVYVEDIANANILAATTKYDNAIYNVASGVETSLRELLDRLCEVMQSTISPEFREARKVSPVSRRLADTTSARDKLGFTTQFTLDDGLRRLVEWWRAQA